MSDAWLTLALMKLLIVDDDAPMREALAVGLQLQWEDVEVMVAADVY
jgi:hypothetical protein